MGADLALTEADFEKKVIESELPVMIDFWAAWCGPCLAIAPHVEAISNELDGKAKVFKVDVDSEGDLAARFGVMSIPALLVFKGGQEVDRKVGAGSKEDIRALIEKYV
ncbi:MAG: thioredoxin [Armatimonadetes bacterium]|nr:thioredoxin [Armatimonadota bacterium]